MRLSSIIKSSRRSMKIDLMYRKVSLLKGKKKNSDTMTEPSGSKMRLKMKSKSTGKNMKLKLPMQLSQL